jgi:UDP-N-acetylglucosamine 2-epimerase (non-hydrolysing)
MTEHRIAVFLGTRPEAIKMAPIVKALRGTAGCKPIVVSTGQHRELLAQVLSALELEVDVELDVMVEKQTLAGLSARVLERVDAVLAEERPDFALVQGDTTTVLMAAIACYYRGTPLGHVEAGLRTGDLRAPFPEEGNRRLVSPLAALHFAPTESARDNLLREGVAPGSIHVTGNTVVDALHLEVERQKAPEQSGRVAAELERWLGPGWAGTRFVLITGHRRESFGDGFDAICRAIATLAKRFPDVRFVYPVHLNPSVQGPVRATLSGFSNVALLPPLPYGPFVALLRACRLVLTDSGGVQEEAPGLGKPVLVMRDTTERPEGIAAGTARLVGADEGRIAAGVSELLTDDVAWRRMATARNPYGDGHAAQRIVAAVLHELARA